jgi:hypothetical protein
MRGVIGVDSGGIRDHDRNKSKVVPTDGMTLDPALPAWITPELIELTIRIWQPYYETPLTSEEAIAMLIAVGGLFNVIHTYLRHSIVAEEMPDVR